MINRAAVRIILLLCLFTSSFYGQIKFKTYSEKIDKGFKFLADNNEYCPVSVKVNFVLNNMSSSKGNYKIFVIPPRVKNHLITKLKFKHPGSYSYRSSTKFNFGNILKEEYDKEYIY